MVRRLARSRMFWVAGALLAALVAYLALGVFGLQTLFYDTEVNEDFAAAGPTPGDRTVVSSGEFHAVAHPGKEDVWCKRFSVNFATAPLR